MHVRVCVCVCVCAGACVCLCLCVCGGGGEIGHAAAHAHCNGAARLHAQHAAQLSSIASYQHLLTCTLAPC